MWPVQVGNVFIATGHFTEVLFSNMNIMFYSCIPKQKPLGLLVDLLTLPFIVCTFGNVLTQTTSSGADKDPYEEWTYDDFFKEDGIVLDPQTSLPVAYELTSAVLPICGKLAFLNIGTI